MKVYARLEPATNAARQIWRVVSGLPSGKRERRVFVMLMPQAYIDESGNEPTKPHFILAGFVAPAANWAAFADEWQVALDEAPRLNYFKMNEAARLRGEFDRKNGWDEAKRDDRLITFTRIIRKFAGIRIHARIKHADFNKHIRSIPVPYRKLASDNPYILMFSQIIMAMSVRQDLFGVNEPCDFIFDEQGGFSVDALASWSSIKDTMIKNRKPGYLNLVGSPPMFKDEKEVLPLQAADLYAWQMRNYFIQNQIIIAPVNRVLGQLVDIPLIERVCDEEELIRLRESLLKVGAQLAKENPDVSLVHIGEGKGERRTARRKAKKPSPPFVSKKK